MVYKQTKIFVAEGEQSVTISLNENYNGLFMTCVEEDGQTKKDKFLTYLNREEALELSNLLRQYVGEMNDRNET